MELGEDQIKFIKALQRFDQASEEASSFINDYSTQQDWEKARRAIIAKKLNCKQKDFALASLASKFYVHKLKNSAGNNIGMFGQITRGQYDAIESLLTKVFLSLKNDEVFSLKDEKGMLFTWYTERDICIWLTSLYFIRGDLIPENLKLGGIKLYDNAVYYSEDGENDYRIAATKGYAHLDMAEPNEREI